MAIVGILRYAPFHHVEHGLTDGSVHYLHYSSDCAACQHQLCVNFALVMDCLFGICVQAVHNSSRNLLPYFDH
jgi:hypothetical protein